MKKLREIFKRIIVHSVIFSLIQTSFVFSAHAELSQGVQAGLGAANTALNLWSQSNQMKNQIQMSIAQQQANANMITKYGPNCKKTDGTSCYDVAGKFFPECALPPTVAGLPQNVCSEKPAQIQQFPNAKQSMISYEKLAQEWVQSYDLQLNEASNSKVPTGLKCLGDKKKALDSEMLEMVNNLTRMQEQFSSFKQKFQNQNNKMLTDLAAMKEELEGATGAGKNNLNLKVNSFMNGLSSSCKAILGDEKVAQGAQVGLIAIMNSLEPNKRKASDYQSNRTAIEAEVNADIAKIQNSIKNGGLQDYFDGKIADTSKYKSLVAATQKQATEFKIAKDRIAKELEKVGYPLPTMDKNFSADFNDFVATSKDFFKKKYVNDCITGADKTVTGMTMDQLLSTIKQVTTNNSGNADENYTTAIREVLERNLTPAQKVEEIKKLEGKYKDITFTYRGSGGQKVRETPYDFFNKTLAKCETLYTQSSQQKGSGTDLVSQQKIIERSQGLLRELQSLHDNYSGNLAARVLEQVQSCNGESKKAGSSCGDAESFDYTAASFCMSHADQCANDVSACEGKVRSEVQKRKTSMEAIASTFNLNAEALRKQSNEIFNSQKAAVMNLVKTVQARFPGTNFLIPENMFIPELTFKSDTYGIPLASDGSLAFMDDMPKKLELLKKVFKDQQDKVDDEIQDYISKQAAAMQTQKGRWNELAGQCKEMVASMQSDIDKYNAEGTKNQMEQDAKVGSFCRKYSNMKTNPLGACQDAKSLAEDADKIAARLTNSALYYTGKFRNVCNQFNNEANSADDCDSPESTAYSKYDPKTKRRCDALWKAETKRLEAEGKSGKGRKVTLMNLCEKDETSDLDFVKAVGSKLPEEDRDVLKNVSDISKIDRNKLTQEGSDFFEGILSLPKFKTENVCKQLREIDKGGKVVGDLEKETREKEIEVVGLKTKIAEATTKIDTISGKLTGPLEAAAKEKLEAEKKTLEDSKKELDAKLLSAESTIKYNKAANDKVILKAAIEALTPAPATKDEQKELALRSIGEQADQSCDAQMSNVMSNGKISGFQSEVQALDAKLFGR
ncbi:MAG: hypothetical protein K2Q18_02065 [Bdellovibrionales bacterium]|nr:hypothetical protein [Bdellovibrionales bacterium]